MPPKSRVRGKNPGRQKVISVCKGSSDRRNNPIKFYDKIRINPGPNVGKGFEFYFLVLVIKTVIATIIS